MLEMLRPIIGAISRFLWGLSFKGTENIPHNTDGLIIAGNHQTYFDPFWIAVPIKRPLRFLAWNEVFDWPIVGKFMGILGAWPLHLEGSDPTAIRRSLQWLRSGGAVVIFPEGGRGPADGSLAKFKTGAARMALEANVSILPVTVRGAHRVWPIGQRFPRLAKVEITFHPVHKLTPQPGEDTRQCARRETDSLADAIRSSL